MSSWKASRFIQHEIPFGNSWQLLTKIFLYSACLVIFAQIIDSISIPRDKGRVMAFEASWILFPDGNNISPKLSPSDCPDLFKAVECDLVMTLAPQHLVNPIGSPGLVLVQGLPSLILLWSSEAKSSFFQIFSSTSRAWDCSVLNLKQQRPR